MKIAVIGSRSFNDYDLLTKTLDDVKGISLIVSGAAKGADTLGEKYALGRGISTLIFKPDWKKFGKSAGYRRNVDIIDNADIVYAFWDGISKGTKHSISVAHRMKKKVVIVKFTPLPEQLPLHNNGIALVDI